MKVNVTQWQISTLFSQKNDINEQPEYQRGEVWNDNKKRVLIDSILRGIDIPKVYLRKLNGGAYKYEVADGQQRLTSIYKFKEDLLSLLSKEVNGIDLSRVNGEHVGKSTYSSLPNHLQKHFDEYKITIAVIEDATNNEIRTLFGRLQLGSPLNPAEKRNAIVSTVGNHIDSIAMNHLFFQQCRVPSSRFKHQDYLAHIFALIAYKNKQALKADLLEKLYLDKDITWSHDDLKTITDILDKIVKIDEETSSRIYKKFHFIDVFWFLHNNRSKLNSLNVKGFANAFDDFENRRLSIQDPEALIAKDDASDEEKNMYKYYMAFRYAGSSVESIRDRADVFNSVFNEYL